MTLKSFNHDFTYERAIKNTISRKILYNRYRSFKDADKQEQHYFRNVKIDIIEENKRIRFKRLSMGIYEYCWRNLKGYRRNKIRRQSRSGCFDADQLHRQQVFHLLQQ